MKKFISILLSCIFIMCMIVIPTSAESSVNISVSSATGFASQKVDVNVVIDNAISASAIQIKIKYDEKLELVKAQGNASFTDVYSNSVSGSENGEYSYVALASNSKESPNVDLAAGSVIATLSFVLPSYAKDGDEFAISVDLEESEIVTTKSDLSSQINTITAANGKITCASANNCGGAHTFGETVTVSEQTYITYGYSYKICTACSYTEITKKAPINTNIITPVGTAIKYTGTPRGIGAAFLVDKEAVAAIEALGYTLEIGTDITQGKNSKRIIYYGFGTSNENKTVYETGTIYDKIEGIGSYDEVRMCAYVRIIDENGSFYEEKTYADINGDVNISISDVVSIMTISKYDAASREYLNAVLNGIAQ
ncbi:MAG: hypothetical protein J6B60_02635 [Clostridia bacterium]|nr:hypothetical protein [Clostridia bacterium]